MARNKFTDELKLKIIEDYKAGVKQKLICVKYSIAKSSVSKIIKRYYKNHTVTTNHSGGRPRKTSKKEDKLIAKEWKKCPSLTPRDVINKLQLDVSYYTVRRRVNEAGLGSYRFVERPLVRDKNRYERLQFAKEHLNWTSSQWKSIIFSDESVFNLRDRKANDTIKVWACFSGQVVGPIHRLENSAKEKDAKCLDAQQAPKVVQDWLQSAGANFLKWPTQSTDLNPVEELWEIIDQKIRKENYCKLDELYNAVSSEWDKISMETIEGLINSMHRRCVAVVEQKGYPTKYWPRSTYAVAGDESSFKQSSNTMMGE